jgi:hypothetical protein
MSRDEGAKPLKRLMLETESSSLRNCASLSSVVVAASELMMTL